MRNPPCLVKSDPAPIPSGKKKCAGVLGDILLPSHGPEVALLELLLDGVQRGGRGLQVSTAGQRQK